MIHSIIEGPASRFGAISKLCRACLDFVRLSKAHPAFFRSFWNLSSPCQPLEALWGPLSHINEHLMVENLNTYIFFTTISDIQHMCAQIKLKQIYHAIETLQLNLFESWKLWTFLDTSSHLYKRSVRPSVHPLVGPSVGWSVGWWRFCKKQGKSIY